MGTCSPRIQVLRFRSREKSSEAFLKKKDLRPSGCIKELTVTVSPEAQLPAMRSPLISRGGVSTLTPGVVTVRSFFMPIDLSLPLVRKPPKTPTELPRHSPPRLINVPLGVCPQFRTGVNGWTRFSGLFWRLKGVNRFRNRPACRYNYL